MLTSDYPFSDEWGKQTVPIHTTALQSNTCPLALEKNLRIETSQGASSGARTPPPMRFQLDDNARCDRAHFVEDWPTFYWVSSVWNDQHAQPTEKKYGSTIFNPIQHA
ncbi:hypothetical protein AVEN_151410-1 [Araneus ventricosus]|uniref:Uncharacterized protein n=1 Tax=Araneus ventricosus TaxID=182803 RepID=A0A4Y2C9G0_ARAVE|nr:hypothetical protein AVEN_151410-1 [Araneus ventricosus]